MSWKQPDPVEEKPTEKQEETQKDDTENKDQESKTAEDPAKETTDKVDDKLDNKTEDNKDKKDPEESEEMVSRKVLGAVAKKIRDRGKSELAEAERRIQQLKEENEKLRKGETVTEPDPNDPSVIEQKVKLEYLRKQDEYGRKKYGEESYKEAVLIVQAQNDPSLVQKIQDSATPADTLMQEAMKIAENLQYGDTPEEREKKKLADIEAKVRKKVEAEFAEKLKVLGNQTTDVSKVRSGGGDSKARNISSWSTSLK